MKTLTAVGTCLIVLPFYGATIRYAGCWRNLRGKMAEGVPVDPPLKAHFPFLSLWAWDPPATPTLSLPFSSGSAGTSRLPPLLILGCFSELITLSTLLPLKNSANYKNPVALDICGRADNGSRV